MTRTAFRTVNASVRNRLLGCGSGAPSQLVPQLNEIVGLPANTPESEIERAAENCSQTLFDRAAHGDENAQQKLIELHVAYLNWAYAKRAP